jgi:hypothetical protein
MDTNRFTTIDAVKTASGLNVVAGIGLILAPFVLGYTEIRNALWNDVIVGLIVVAIATYRVAYPLRNAELSWVNALLGLWLIVAPFILNYDIFLTPLWNDVILGILVAGLALWSALSAESTGRLFGPRSRV